MSIKLDRYDAQKLIEAKKIIGGIADYKRFSVTGDATPNVYKGKLTYRFNVQNLYEVTPVY